MKHTGDAADIIKPKKLTIFSESWGVDPQALGNCKLALKQPRREYVRAEQSEDKDCTCNFLRVVGVSPQALGK